jgi:hypothetical protein
VLAEIWKLSPETVNELGDTPKDAARAPRAIAVHSPADASKVGTMATARRLHRVWPVRRVLTVVWVALSALLVIPLPVRQSGPAHQRAEKPNFPESGLVRIEKSGWTQG